MICLVEDHPDLIYMMRQLFESEGWPLKTIECNFQDAFRPETWDGVDSAVVDLMLPGVEGEDICKYLKSNFPEIRVIVLSAVAHIRHIGPEVADYVLTKPASIDDIRRALGKTSD